ncbi:MAG: UDP-N-acetylmuramate--L-alanine ligase [Bifidobacteriaceae bacterium]|jgi:UDP-N-acetylmuramate--alanine ligase|nr:UDP-N-acetylmuramate--L-alanine ligase [Bifidobacteriaceae bacterium]
MVGAIHLMGVGGVGMAAVAELLVAQGLRVSGCDSADSARLARLRSLGVETRVGHSPDHLAGVGRVVVSSAVKEAEPELAAARRDPAIEVEHRSQALARIANRRRLVAVAGAHGKTTTSAMVVAALEAAGLDPSYAIGSELVGRGSGARLGAGDIMVIEADESDGSFLNYRPEVAVVTNVEPDHLDHYGTPEALTQAFRDFAAQIRTPGVLIACDADPGAAALANWARQRWEPRGREGIEAPAVWEYGDFSPGGEPPSTRLPGRHMALNAAAAGLVARWFGADQAAARAGLLAFEGTARRFEERGEARGVRVVDDYAHHPTEIAATLAAAREQAAGGRLLVVFQPHLYSRTASFHAEFAEALGAADRVWLMDVYGAREAPRPDVTSALIADRMDPQTAVLAAALPGVREGIPAAVAGEARAGDLVITMGAGDVTDLADPILAALAES